MWTRLTQWRALLAAALDFPPHDTITSAAVTGEAISPSTDLMAGWLAARLGVKVRRSRADGAGMVSVRLERRSGPVELIRPDGRTGTLRQPGQPDRLIALARRTVPDCLAEELRRLDPDEVYGEALVGIGQISRGRSSSARSSTGRSGTSAASNGAPEKPPGDGGGRRPRMSRRDIVVHANPDVLAAAAAARLVTRLVDVQAAGRVPRLVLTGGGIGTALLEHLAQGPAHDAVDWAHVEFYWGDERFLPPGDPERNETGARQALLDHLPVDPARVHPMGADTGTGPSGAEAAAQAYADLLARDARPEDHGPVPTFDVTLLGMGGEGHTASIFPHSPAVYETERTVVAVHGCPKPPPTRVSLTLPAIRRSTEVWILATGDAKAGAVALALSGAGEVAIPVAGATGTRRTLWLLDRAAAAKLPRDLAPAGRLRRPSHPMLHLVVDAANVVGSRPDGWWRDRAGAARRLAGSIVAVLVSRPEDLVELLDGTTPDSAETAGSDLAVAAVQVHLVLEGAAGAVEDLPTHPLLDVVHAPADGDSAIVDLVEELVGGPGRVLVVTADRALRARVHAAGAEVTGPGTFRAALPEAGPR